MRSENPCMSTSTKYWIWRPVMPSRASRVASIPGELPSATALG